MNTIVFMPISWTQHIRWRDIFVDIGPILHSVSFFCYETATYYLCTAGDNGSTF